MSKVMKFSVTIPGRIQELKRRTEELTGRESDVDFWTTSAVKNKTLNQLIDEKVLDQLLEQSLFTISDEQIATQVRAIEAFKEDGTFSRELYGRMLNLNGLTEVRLKMECALTLSGPD